MKTTSLILIIIVIAIIVVIGGYFLYQNSQNPVQQSFVPNGSVSSSENSISSSAQSQAQNLSEAVNIQNFAFNPTLLNIKVGTTVTWTNNDSAPHQIKSSTFNSSVMQTGGNYSFKFTTVGTFNYSCAIHPSMLGKIIVAQ